jgi:glycosyltransferase involved in cell wall biosynthesis
MEKQLNAVAGTTPEVSIVLCFYNEEKYMEETIESILNQTFTSWELLLVDDGSTDKSIDLALAYAQRYPDRIFYLCHEDHANRGLSASRNAGIKRARGAYVAFIDADDIWLPHKLAFQLTIFQRYPEVSVVLEASLYWHSWYYQRKDMVVPVGAEQDQVYRAPELMLQLYPLGKGAAPCPSGIMVKRSVFSSSLFEESFRGMYQMYEDQAFLCKLYLKENIYVSSACHNKYRQRPASLVSSVFENGKYHTVRQHYLEWFENYLAQENVTDHRIWKLLNRALMPYRQPFLYKCLEYYPKLVKKHVATWLVRAGVLNYSKK